MRTLDNAPRRSGKDANTGTVSEVRLLLVGSAVTAVSVATLPPPQRGADHTPLPGTVTLVGSLQSELGCPGDWQPDATPPICSR